MAKADGIKTLDAATFERLKENVKNSKARKLIHNDAMKDAHVIAERQMDRAKIIDKSQAGDAFDGMMNSYSTSQRNANHSQLNDEIGQDGVQYDQMLQQRMQNLKENMSKQSVGEGLGLVQRPMGTYNAPMAVNFLPKEITESFKKNPINDSKLNPSQPVLDRLGITNGAKEFVNEQSIRNDERFASQGVDYSLIKTIVESVVKKYASALNKKIISEGKTRSKLGMSELKPVKIGDKSGFVAPDGSVYVKLQKKVKL